MKLTLHFLRPGLADGAFELEARGALLGVLRWANADGPLEDWTILGYIPLDMNGRGCFRLAGGRAVPPEATHISAEVIGPDFERRGCLLAEIPERQRVRPLEGARSFAVMSDLHLSTKPGRVCRALGLAKGADCVLLAGDMTNDGLPEQFEALRALIEEELPNVPVLAVSGNHDWPVAPLPLVRTGVDDYPSLQRWLLERARGMGVRFEEAGCGAYVAEACGLRVFGLNATSHWRRFTFPGGEQLDWLESRLRESARSIVLCHAPLRAHNPVREANQSPYLSRDARLQEIMDGARNAIYISGHTHISLAEPGGCVDWDEARSNVYINDASVVATTLRQGEALTDREWLDGMVLRLNVSEHAMEICARTLSQQKKVSRGYYRWIW